MTKRWITIKVPEDKYKELKIQAINELRTITAILEELIDKYLKERKDG